MKIALTGATGLLGRFILKDLLARNCHIRALSRKAVKPEDSLNWITGSLAEPDTLAKLVEGCDSLVHCAFQHKAGSYRGGEGEQPVQFWQANFMGTLQLLEAARAAAVQRVILLSSRAVFTHAKIASSTAKLDDDHAQNPDTHYGALKVATENLGRLYAELDDFTVVSLRPTGIYGINKPLQDSKWYAIAKQVLAGESIQQDRTSTEVHGQDVASAIWLLLNAEARRVNGRGYNCSDIVVNTQQVADIMHSNLKHTQVAAPEPKAEVSGRMSCTGLTQLGWQPGGLPLLNRTISELLSACQTERELNAP